MELGFRGLLDAGWSRGAFVPACSWRVESGETEREGVGVGEGGREVGVWGTYSPKLAWNPSRDTSV